MKKTFALPLVAALLLAACSNPADGSNPAALPQAPAAQQEEKWPQITPVNFNVDLEGFEECPKDEVYGINWVFIVKSHIDNGNCDDMLNGENYRIKPIEFHKSNPNGVQFGKFLATKGWVPEEGAYKCVVYRKKGNAGVGSFYREGCYFHYIPDGDEGFYMTENLSASRLVKEKTKINNGEKFREVYKY